LPEKSLKTKSGRPGIWIFCYLQKSAIQALPLMWFNVKKFVDHILLNMSLSETCINVKEEGIEIPFLLEQVYMKEKI